MQIAFCALCLWFVASPASHRSLASCVKTHCRANYHLHCAIADNGEWHPVDRHFFCHSHVADATRACMKLCQFPQSSRVVYARECDWSHIQAADRDLIYEHRYRWEAYNPYWCELR